MSDRFWSKVQYTPGCWLWTASLRKNDGSAENVFLAACQEAQLGDIEPIYQPKEPS